MGVTGIPGAGGARRRLRVGLRVPPAGPSPRLRRLVARCVDAGIDSLWWPDHLMAFATPDLWSLDPPDLASLHVYGDPFVAMASCAEVLGGVTVGTCVTDAIRRSPASLVQSAMTVDWAVSGQVVLGLGAGEPANYKPYGITVESPAGVLDSAAHQIRALLDSPGPLPDGAILGLRPRDPGRPPALWLAAHGPRGLRLAGQLADGWLPTQLGPRDWAAGRAIVRAAASSAGRDPDSVQCGLSLDVVLADTRAEAIALLSHPVVRANCLLLPASVFARYGVRHPLGGAGQTELVPTVHGERMRRAVDAIPDQLVRDIVVHGDVDDVVTAISSYPELDHVRLSDLGGAARPGRGGLARLTAVAAALRQPE
jgi:phthiodiolone/phenolphthiodiolone dimycocerosates ketoreductase